MKDLELWFKENKSDIYNEEPPEGHLLRFQEKLDSGKNRSLGFVRQFPHISKYAALLLLPLSLLFFLPDEKQKEAGNLALFSEKNCVDEESELCEALQFYQQKIIANRADLQALNCPNGKGEKKEIEKVLNELQEEYTELERQWKLYPKNEKIKAILLENLRMQDEFLETTLFKLKPYC